MNLLVTCIDFRAKYLDALGGSLIFGAVDYVVDITNVVLPSRGRLTFPDYLADNSFVITLDDLQQFECVLNELKPTNIFVFRPQATPEMDEVYEIFREYGGCWGVVSNKATLRNPLRLINPTRILFHYLARINSYVLNDFESNYYFTNSEISNWREIRKLKPKKIIRIRHLDTVSRNIGRGIGVNQNNYGVFIDQYLPFQKKGIYKHLDILKNASASDYYHALCDYLEYAKKRFNLDDIIIARHPNSSGAELSYISRFDALYGHTESLIRESSIVITHHSNAISFALQYNKQLVLLDIGEILSPRFRREVRKKWEQCGGLLHTVESGQVHEKKSARVSSWIKSCLYRIYYCATCPDFASSVLNSPWKPKSALKGIDKHPGQRRLQGVWLSEFKKIAETHGISPILSDGVVLGIVRENDFIEWDWDSEYFVEYLNIENLDIKSLKSDLVDMNFEIVKSRDSRDSWKLTVRKYWFEIELRAWNRIGDIFVRVDGKGRQYSVPVKFFDNLDSIQFYGEGYFIPSDSDDYLTYLYGDWKLPIKSTSPEEYLSTRVYTQTDNKGVK